MSTKFQGKSPTEEAAKKVEKYVRQARPAVYMTEAKSISIGVCSTIREKLDTMPFSQPLQNRQIFDIV
jgi:hypothetical protein